MTGSHKDNLNAGLAGALFRVRVQFRPGQGTTQEPEKLYRRHDWDSLSREAGEGGGEGGRVPSRLGRAKRDSTSDPHPNPLHEPL